MSRTPTRGGSRGGDRFIPNRSTTDMEAASHYLLNSTAAAANSTSGMVTNSIFFCFLFVKNHWFAWRENQWPLVGETLLFRSSQRLPRLCLVRCFRSYRDTRTQSGMARWARRSQDAFNNCWCKPWLCVCCKRTFAPFQSQQNRIELVTRPVTTQSLATKRTPATSKKTKEGAARVVSSLLTSRPSNSGGKSWPTSSCLKNLPQQVGFEAAFHGGTFFSAVESSIWIHHLNPVSLP